MQTLECAVRLYILVHTCERILYSNRGMVNSPGFPGLYWSNINSCLAEIIGPPGSVITLEFVTFNVEEYFGHGEVCGYDKVEVMTDYFRLIS